MMNVRTLIRARRRLVGMSSRRTARLLCAAVVTWVAAPLSAPVPSASAQPCPDVEVVFARGSGEPPGVGGTGQAFVDSLGSRVGSRSVGVYPVNYEASTDFDNRIGFATSVLDGIEDAMEHMESTTANCPKTRMVLGGYSQGAALAAFVTSASVPKGVPAEYVSFIPKPLPAAVADHVAAVVLFGNPSNEFLTSVDAPSITIGPLYRPKTIELCAAGDTICNGAPAGGPPFAHLTYSSNGMVDEGADFAAGRL